MTTRYNVYFNGIENYKEQLKNMESNYEDNFTRLVHMHPVSAYGNPKETKPNGSFDRTIEKCQKAIKLHSIQKKPKRNQNKMHDPKYREYVKRQSKAEEKLERGIDMLLEVAELKYGRQYAQSLKKKMRGGTD